MGSDPKKKKAKHAKGERKNKSIDTEKGVSKALSTAESKHSEQTRSSIIDNVDQNKESTSSGKKRSRELIHDVITESAPKRKKKKHSKDKTEKAQKKSETKSSQDDEKKLKKKRSHDDEKKSKKKRSHDDEKKSKKKKSHDKEKQKKHAKETTTATNTAADSTDQLAGHGSTSLTQPPSTVTSSSKKQKDSVHTQTKAITKQRASAKGPRTSYMLDSDSENETVGGKEKETSSEPNTAKSRITNPSGSANDGESESDSESESGDNNEARRPPKKRKRTEPSVLYSDRLNPTLIKVHADPKIMYANRIVKADIPTVNPDFFLSDSESDTDSESEPEGEPELEWHRKIENGALIREKAKANAWPIKTGKWNAEELLRLEKRIKKLARRRNMTLESFREEILTQPFRNKKQFWWDVAKKFPDRALYHIVRHGKQAYDRQNYQGQWTPEEDKQLLELVKTYGRKFATTIKDQMNRTASACEARYRTIKHQEVGKTGKWTNEESEKLKKTITEYKTLHGTPPSWEYVSSKGFQNERNPRQCKARWQYIQNQENNAGQVTGRGAVTIEDQIRLLERIQKGGWQKEYEIPFGKLQDENFTLSSKRCKSEYIKLRKHIPGFEKMKVQDIVSELLRTRCIMLESLKE